MAGRSGEAVGDGQALGNAEDVVDRLEQALS